MYYNYIHSHQLEGPATNKNEYYSLRQLEDPVYDDASSTQPNYTLGPDIEAVSNPVTNGYDSIEWMTKPKKEQHLHDRANTREKKKAEKISNKNNKPKTNGQESSLNPTPVRDDDNKKGDDFYDAEEHVYSVVIKSKKKANKKLSENCERERGKGISY